MTSTTARRTTRGPTTIVRRRYRRIDWLILRWQARLDAQWADRVAPWIAAGILFAVLFTVALARVDRVDAGVDLARAAQAAWHVAGLRTPEITLGDDVNYLALQFPVAFVPVAVVTRVLPAHAVLLAAQSASLALGVVPLWHLARKVANLRVGAAAALVFAYALHPAIAELDLADFHAATMAMAPLLVAAYAAERRQWRRFAVFSAAAAACGSELGLVIAALGLMLVLEGERRIGGFAACAGLAWTVVALFVVQAPLGTGLVGARAFESYGDTGLEVLIEVLRNPFRPVGDLLAAENVNLVVWVLAPLLFLPILSLRQLLPALPLTALYMIADVPMRGADGGGRVVPLVAFAFVAAPFALARLGRPSIERVLVDRRLLVLLATAAVAALVTTSPFGPYADGWRRDGEREDDLRAAVAAVPDSVPARVPAELTVELAERRRIELLEPGESDPSRLTDGVDVVVLDEAGLEDFDDHELFLLRRRIEDEGFVLIERSGVIDVFVRR